MFSGRIVWNFKKLIIGLLVYVVYASVCAGRISGQESLLLAGENGPGRGVSNRPSSSGFSGEQLPELLAAAEPPVDDDDDDDEDDSFEISENFSATGSKVWGRASVKGKKIELGGKELYQVLQVVVTVPRIKPGTFKKKWTKQYARVMASELETLIHKPVKVRVTGVQGEDTGSGVFTQILIGERVSGEVLTFLTDEFIKKDTGTMFKGMFGEAVHIEAFADTCIMGSDFEDALEDTPQLVPTLHASIALEDRKATRKNMKFYCPRVAKALRTWLEKNGAASTSTYDFFVDNDEKLGKDKDRGGHKSKPVCNVIIQGPLKEDLVRLQDLIRSIGGYRGKKTKQNVLFSSSLRLGKVHVEGGSLIPAVCGSLPSHVIAQKAPVGTDLDRSVLARRSLFALRSLHVLTLSLAPRASLVRQVIKEVDYVPGATSATLMVAEPTTGKRPFKLNGLAFTSGEPPVTCPCHCPCKATGGRTSVMIHSCPFPEKALNASRVYSFSVAGTDGSENPLPVSYAEHGDADEPESDEPESDEPESDEPHASHFHAEPHANADTPRVCVTAHGTRWSDGHGERQLARYVVECGDRPDCDEPRGVLRGERGDVFQHNGRQHPQHRHQHRHDHVIHRGQSDGCHAVRLLRQGHQRVRLDVLDGHEPDRLGVRCAGRTDQRGRYAGPFDDGQDDCDVGLCCPENVGRPLCRQHWTSGHVHGCFSGRCGRVHVHLVAMLRRRHVTGGQHSLHLLRGGNGHCIELHVCPGCQRIGDDVHDPDNPDHQFRRGIGRGRADRFLERTIQCCIVRLLLCGWNWPGVHGEPCGWLNLFARPPGLVLAGSGVGPERGLIHVLR